MSMQNLSWIIETSSCYLFPYFIFYHYSMVTDPCHILILAIYYGKMLGEINKKNLEQCSKDEKFKKPLSNLKNIFIVIFFRIEIF